MQVWNPIVVDMVFYLAEVEATEFRLKMLPMTPMRRKGDRVELTYVPNGGGTAIVQTLFSAPRVAVERFRIGEHLTDRQTHDSNAGRRGA